MADENGRPPNHWSRTMTLCRGVLAGVCKRVAEVMANAHKTSLSMWYAYVVSASVLGQEYWQQMEEYVPVTWRHRIILAMTVVVMADKINRAAKATRPRPPDANA